MIVPILIITCCATVIAHAKMHQVYEPREAELIIRHTALQRIFVGDRSCLHYHDCEQPGPKNAPPLRYSKAQREALAEEAEKIKLAQGDEKWKAERELADQKEAQEHAKLVAEQEGIAFTKPTPLTDAPCRPAASYRRKTTKKTKS